MKELSAGIMSKQAGSARSIAAAAILATAIATASAGPSEAAFPPGANGLIAFASLRDGGDYDVFVMGADGSAPTNLTSASAAVDYEPDWQRLEPPPLPVASDTDPPETTIDKGPKKKTAKRKAKFQFSTDEPGSTFECKLDKKNYKPCAPPFKKKVKADKKHKFLVRAVDAAGNVDPTPAKRKWKVKEKS